MDTFYDEPSRTSYEEDRRDTTLTSTRTKRGRRTKDQFHTLHHLKAVAESHPFQFRLLDLCPFRHTRSGGTWAQPVRDEWNEVRAWLDEHAPGWLMVHSYWSSDRVAIPDLVSAVAFKMRWL